MAKLEDLKRGAQVKGIDPHQPVTVVDIQWHGMNAIELFYKRADGQPGTQLLYRDSEPNLEGVQWQKVTTGKMRKRGQNLHITHHKQRGDFDDKQPVFTSGSSICQGTD